MYDIIKTTNVTLLIFKYYKMCHTAHSPLFLFLSFKNFFKVLNKAQ